MTEKYIKVSCFGIITDQQGRILMGRRAVGEIARDRIILPGGGAEFGEEPNVTVVREVLEETGIHAKVETTPALVKNFILPDKHRLILAYRGLAIAGEPTATDEITKPQFYSVKEIIALKEQISDPAWDILRALGLLSPTR